MNWIGERYRASGDPERTERRVELILVLLGLLLILQLVYGASRLAMISIPEPVAPTKDSLQVRNLLGQTTITPEQGNAIRSRPLLWPSRRPVAAAPVVVDEAANARKQALRDIKLLGVFGTGDTAGVIVRVKDKTLRVGLGEDVAGWTLASVGKTGAVFSMGSRQETLKLLPEQIGKADKQKKRIDTGGR